MEGRSAAGEEARSLAGTRLVASARAAASPGNPSTATAQKAQVARSTYPTCISQPTRGVEAKVSAAHSRPRASKVTLGG